jgi:hypothetical protein
MFCVDVLSLLIGPERKHGVIVIKVKMTVI